MSLLRKVGLNLALAGVGLVAGHLFSMAVNGRKNKKPITRIQIGDLIQWESRGAFVFAQPKKIVDIQANMFGTYAFVEDSMTGIPVEQIVVIKRRDESCES